jgi:phosphoribosyl-ATP pyrophosphohydrolase
MKPNMIERLENLIHALDEARDALYSVTVLLNPDDVDTQPVFANIDNAGGIAGEILTMIDGR